MARHAPLGRTAGKTDPRKPKPKERPRPHPPPFMDWASL